MDLLAEGLLGPNSAGECLWHQHGIGLVAVLMERDDTPRALREQLACIVSWDRAELHVRRGRGPADTRARAKQVLEAAQAAIAYGREIGLVEEEED